MKRKKPSIEEAGKKACHHAFEQDRRSKPDTSRFQEKKKKTKRKKKCRELMGGKKKRHFLGKSRTENLELRKARLILTNTRRKEKILIVCLVGGRGREVPSSETESMEKNSAIASSG